jgi:hypothetical protein
MGSASEWGLEIASGAVWHGGCFVLWEVADEPDGHFPRR